MGWCSRLAAWSRRAAVLASAAGAAVLSPGGLAPSAAAASWPASGPGGGAIGDGQLGLVPALGPQGQSTSYFHLAVAPGQSVTATVIVTNLSKRTQAVILRRAIGATSNNGGSIYLPVTGRCSGPACWVTGLPGNAITLRGGGYTAPVSFAVRVPPRTPPGQYLSGITAVPATVPRPVSLGSNGMAGTQAVIIRTVTVGVAITVGDVSGMTPRLSIRGVRGSAAGEVPRLNISLYNTGRIFARGKGEASCLASGRRHSYTVYANTVLPGEHSVVAVNALGLREGATAACAIRIGYGKNQAVTWSGRIVIPYGARAVPYVSDGKGGFIVGSRAGFPRWGIGLIVIGLLLAAGTAWVICGRRRPRWRR